MKSHLRFDSTSKQQAYYQEKNPRDDTDYSSEAGIKGHDFRATLCTNSAPWLSDNRGTFHNVGLFSVSGLDRERRFWREFLT